MFWLFAVAGLVSNLLLSGPGWADDSNKRFQLFAGCLPMRAFVIMTDAPRSWKPIKKEAQKIIEEPLRQLNLYKSPDSYSNFIALRISGKGPDLVSMTLEYHKILSDPASNLVSLSPTWLMHHVATLPDQRVVRAHIEANVLGLVIEFLKQYLEVNIQRCRARLPSKAFENWHQHFKEKSLAPSGALE